MAPTNSLAWVSLNGKRFIAKGFGGNYSPETPVTRLIRGVYARYPAEALKILRQRLFADYPISSLCRAAVGVAAKRISVQTECPPLNSEEIIDVTESGWGTERDFFSPAAPPKRGHSWLNVATRIASVVEVSEQRFESSRQVGAILVLPDECRAWSSTNTNATIKTSHAEMNLLTQLSIRNLTPIPRGSTIYVSLKPCKMCAAAIVRCAEVPSEIRVVYAQEDNGPLSRNTELDLLKIVFKGMS